MLKRMRDLPKHVLAEIYFKTIVPSMSYGIAVWGNCTPSVLNFLNAVHARACRIIYCIPSTIDDDTCLSTSKWQPIDYIYKRRILVKMHGVFSGDAPKQLSELFTEKKSKRSSRFSNQLDIVRVKSETGRNTFKYRGTLLWNYMNKITHISNIGKNSFKLILKKCSKEISSFSFRKEATMITKKDTDFIYF